MGLDDQVFQEVRKLRGEDKLDQPILDEGDTVGEIGWFDPEGAGLLYDEDFQSWLKSNNKLLYEQTYSSEQHESTGSPEVAAHRLNAFLDRFIVKDDIQKMSDALNKQDLIKNAVIESKNGLLVAKIPFQLNNAKVKLSLYGKEGDWKFSDGEATLKYKNLDEAAQDVALSYAAMKYVDSGKFSTLTNPFSVENEILYYDRGMSTSSRASSMSKGFISKDKVQCKDSQAYAAFMNTLYRKAFRKNESASIQPRKPYLDALKDYGLLENSRMNFGEKGYALITFEQFSRGLPLHLDERPDGSWHLSTGRKTVVYSTLKDALEDTLLARDALEWIKDAPRNVPVFGLYSEALGYEFINKDGEKERKLLSYPKAGKAEYYVALLNDLHLNHSYLGPSTEKEVLDTEALASASGISDAPEEALPAVPADSAEPERVETGSFLTSLSENPENYFRETGDNEFLVSIGDDTEAYRDSRIHHFFGPATLLPKPIHVVDNPDSVEVVANGIPAYWSPEAKTWVKAGSDNPFLAKNRLKVREGMNTFKILPKSTTPVPSKETPYEYLEPAEPRMGPANLASTSEGTDAYEPEPYLAGGEADKTVEGDGLADLHGGGIPSAVASAYEPVEEDAADNAPDEEPKTTIQAEWPTLEPEFAGEPELLAEEPAPEKAPIYRDLSPEEVTEETAAAGVAELADWIHGEESGSIKRDRLMRLLNGKFDNANGHKISLVKNKEGTVEKVLFTSRYGTEPGTLKTRELKVNGVGESAKEEVLNWMKDRLDRGALVDNPKVLAE